MSTTHVLHVDTERDLLDTTLRSFWELESLGICEPEGTVQENFMDAVTFKDGLYEVSLPWKEFHSPLPDNLQLSLKLERPRITNH